MSNETVDPELVRLRRRARVGPLLALSVLGLAAYLLVTLRADFSYAGRGDTPEDAGPAASVAGRAANTYVSLAAVLDHRAPARLWAREGKGHRLAPVLGTGFRLWIHQAKDAPATRPVTDGRFAGRLRRLDDVPFAAALRQYVADLPPQPRYVFPEALAGGVPATDVTGEPLALGPDTRVVVDEKGDAALVTLVQTEAVFDEPTARQTLATAGITSPGAPVETTMASWTFEVPTADVAALRDKLRGARVFGASVEPKLAHTEGVRRDLTVAGGSLALGGRTVPLASVMRVAFYVREPLPDDAYVLLDAETPASFWYMRPLYFGLAAVSGLMLWALVWQFVRARPGKV